MPGSNPLNATNKSGGIGAGFSAEPDSYAPTADRQKELVFAKLQKDLHCLSPTGRGPRLVRSPSDGHQKVGNIVQKTREALKAIDPNDRKSLDRATSLGQGKVTSLQKQFLLNKLDLS